MQEVSSGDSALRRSAEDIRAQLRKNATTEKTNLALFDVLAAAQRNPGRFMATPNRLLEAHPSLKRLKDGLVDAQLRTSTLMGRMSAEHPLVQAAKESEIEIGRNLHDELAIARQGVEAELRMLADRRVLLESQLATTNRRLTNLASVSGRLCQSSGRGQEPRDALGAGRTESGRRPRHPSQRQGREPHQPHRRARRRHLSDRTPAAR